MNFSEKLREIRQNEGLSQEQLAEKIGVSRQAITKWETGKGLPDIENLVIISEIFKTTLDELVSASRPVAEVQKETYTSETVYDIDCESHFDINIGSAKVITISSGTDEKLHVCLASETLENLGSIFKIKLDANRNRLDVDCVRKNKISRYEAEDAVAINILLPEKYADHCELTASVKILEIAGLHIRRLEYDGDAGEVIIADSSGSLEITSKSDHEITVDRVSGRLDINQWKAKSIVHIAKENCPAIVNCGKHCEVYCVTGDADGRRAEPLADVSGKDAPAGDGLPAQGITVQKGRVMKKGEVAVWDGGKEDDNVISVSGIGSEVIINLQ